MERAGGSRSNVVIKDDVEKERVRRGKSLLMMAALHWL